MKTKKIGKILLYILGGTLLSLTLLVLFWLGPTVKLVAQRVGVKALGTPLTIETLSINPRKGTIHLSGFAIANQGVFSKSNAVSLTSLDLAIDMGSIFTETVVVHQVEINSPHFIYEQSHASDNITEFILDIQEFAGIGPDAPAKKENPKRKKSKKLEINDVQFHLANTDDSQLDIVTGFEQLSVSMTNGTVQLDGFFIRNPEDLITPNLFTLDQVALLLEPETVYTSNITINAVQISNPQVYIEHNPETDTLGEFLKIANSLLAHIPPKTTKATETNTLEIADSEDPPPPPPEVILQSLIVEGTRIHVVNRADPKLDIYFGIDTLSAALDKGALHIDNIYLTNPKRLATPNAFSLDTIRVDFSPESLKADTFVIKDVQVLKPYVFLEQNIEANTVHEFMRIADGFISRLPTYSFPEVQQQTNTVAEVEKMEEVNATPPPFELHNLLVDDIGIQLLDSTPTNGPIQPHMLAGIGSISVKLVEGKLKINGITIPNVEGFIATNLFHLSTIEIAIDPDSIHSEQVVINEIFVNSPKVNLEQTEDGGNVATLQTTLMNFFPPSASSSTTSEPTNQVAETAVEENLIPLAEQPVILHSLIVTNLSVNLKFPTTTNAPVMSMTGLSNLNPMDRISLKKLNPLSGAGQSDEAEDPDAPLTILGFNKLSLEPLKGLLYINGLHISNPPGFSRRDLVTMEEFRVDLDPNTLQTDTLIIEDILISRPRIRYERQIMSDNIKALQKEVEQATVRRDEYMEEEKSELTGTATSEKDEGQKVIIEHLLISKGMVQAKLSALPSIPVPLPDIELKDIGKEKGGASATEASTQIFDSFYNSMIGAVSGATGFAGDALKGVGAFTFGTLGGEKGAEMETPPPETEVIDPNAEQEPKKKRKSRRRMGGRRSAL